MPGQKERDGEIEKMNLNEIRIKTEKPKNW
jgi:hypothetical protein